MPPHPRPGSDSANPVATTPAKPLTESDEAATRSGLTAGFESDFAELAAKFAAHGAGNFSAELSAELALEIVLNEIVEGACLAMGATGAAIVLMRDGEMSCRASSGSTAPQLGARLDPGTGISGECVRTRQLQRCDDAQADPRVDMEASRRLGVRSVMAMPLLRNGDLLGVFEVFSSRAAAFGERDERTLDALAQRVLSNLQRASEPIPKPPVAATLPELELHASPATLPTASPSVDAPVSAEGATPSGRGLDLVTWALGLSVLACAILLGVLIGRHFLWQPTPRIHQPVAVSETAPRGQSGASGTSNTAVNPNPAPVSAPAATATAGEKPTTAVRSNGQGGTGAADSHSGEGDLRVYENGKEVFRLPSPPSPAEMPANGQGIENTSASAGEPQQVMQLSPTAAEDSLLHRVEPNYPEAARQQHIQGAVVLDVRIGQDGAVQKVTPVSGNSLLVQAAADAVKQWRFLPRQADGRAVEMQTRITLNFRLPQ